MKLKFKQLTMTTILLLILTLMAQKDAYSQVNQPDIDITRISELQIYTLSYINGEVVKILDEDEFRLQDISGRIQVYTGRSMMLVKKGEKIIVKGYLDREIFGIFKEFYATEIIKENGEIIKIETDD